MPSLWNDLKNLVGMSNKDVNALHEALYSSWYSPFMPITEPRNFTQDLVSGYLENEVVYSIINKIADTASSVPLYVEDLKGNRITNHWINELVANPNNDDTLKDIIFNYYVYLLSIGNSYIYSPKLDDGRYVELWTMPSDLVNVVSGPWYEPTIGYKMKEGNQESIFNKSDVFHGKLFNPRFLNGSWVYGLSPVKVASEIINAINSGNKAIESSFTNMGPPYIITSQLPEGLTVPQQEQLEDTYKKKYGNPLNAGTPMLTGTPVKVEKIGVSPIDLNIIESSQHALRVLCNVYGVPSVLFNDNANSTYNNINQARIDFYQYTVEPLNSGLAGRLKNFLAPNEPVRLKFDYSDIEVLQNAIETKMTTLNTVSFLTVNEKRELVGYPPVSDGDSLQRTSNDQDNAVSGTEDQAVEPSSEEQTDDKTEE